MQNNDLVSVIIPTHQRPKLVIRAIRSVLAQSYRFIEIIVVIDGFEPETVRNIINAFPNKRIKIIEVKSKQIRRKPNYNPRNTGIKKAKGKWVAFLDDDDEWLPDKLKKQLKILNRINSQYPIVASRLLWREPNGHTSVVPQRLISIGERMDRYLFIPGSLLCDCGIGVFQTSTIIAPRLLFKKIMFKGYKHDDWGWVLSVDNICNVSFHMSNEPLVVLHRQQISLSSRTSTEDSLRWGYRNRELFSAEAYFSFTYLYVQGLYQHPIKNRQFIMKYVLCKMNIVIFIWLLFKYFLAGHAKLLMKKVSRLVRLIFIFGQRF